jgi:RNA polymerase sigma-70 factor (ECF subfamily)
MTAGPHVKIVSPLYDDRIRNGNEAQRRPRAVELHLRRSLIRPRSTDRLLELLVRCPLKDDKAFAELYRMSSPKLFAVAMRITRRRDWAEEVLQESFVNIWHHAGSYDEAKSAPMTWMTAIVRNRALDWLRRPREAEADDSHDELLASIPDEHPGPEELLLRTTDSGRLATCLRRLDDEQQRSITLAFFYGLSHGELAAKLRRPLGTVKTWIRRGLEGLRECMEAR